MSNRLAQETSPYLLQHAENPVEWYPWGEEALSKARQEEKPIFLSIGYSACHWCHVMAHESFEDEEVAAYLNEHFVSIKVDREERPDLDRIYMNAIVVLTQSGGWPMTVFLTPAGEPFFGGTYFPPRPFLGRPSFLQILHAVTEAWENRRDSLLRDGKRLTAFVEAQGHPPELEEEEELSSTTLDEALGQLERRFDQMRGGWGNAPKFPQPMALEFLLRSFRRTGDETLWEMAAQTLQAMARGGIYDQLGGGFHRYSVDARWLVPHFEKMLYDNAQLARVYLHAWQISGEPFYRTITEEILDYVAREMTDPAGGFYSTQDADSEGEEGKFFLWTPDEIRQHLGDKAEAFLDAYDVTEKGNFEGRNILELVGDLDKREALTEARQTLLAVREERIHPARDEKILTAWNGLMLAAFAEAARALDRDDYRQIATKNASFLLTELRQPSGRLLRSWKEGRARFNAYLEDYSYLSEGLLELYQTTFEPRWYEAAHQLTEEMIAHFSCETGGFYDTSDDHEALITRPRDLEDNATPSGNAMAATTLLRLAGLTQNPAYSRRAIESIQQLQPLLNRYTLGFCQWLNALDYALAQPQEIAIVGPPEDNSTQSLLAICRQGYQPHRLVALAPPTPPETTVPLLQQRDPLNEQPTAYVCRDFTCLPPTNSPKQLQELLD